MLGLGSVTVELFPLVSALSGVLAGSYMDLKENKIPNSITFSMVAVGVGYHSLQGLCCSDHSIAVLGLAGAIVGFLLTYPLYLLGDFGGGDVKLTAGVGALLPTASIVGSSPGNILFPNLPLFPLTVLIDGLLALSPFVIGYVFFSLLRGEGISAKEVSLSSLKPGMIPAEAVYQTEDGVIKDSPELKQHDRCYADPSDSRGLRDYQIGGLLRLYKEGKNGPSLKIKRTFPFAPAIAGGTFLAILFGNVYFALLTQIF